MDYPLLNAFLTILFIFLFAAWLYLLFAIFNDIFRSHDLSGWAKAGWLVLIFVFPVFGVLGYLIVRGSKMQERIAEQRRRDAEAVRSYIRMAAGAPSPADELAKLDELRRRGLLNDQEFERGKAKILS